MTPAAKALCSKKLWRGFESYPCKLGGKVERDGKWFCGIHDPAAVEKRRKRSMDEFHAKIEARAKDSRLRAAAPRMADELEQFMRDHASKLDCDCPLCLRFGATLRAAGRL